MYTHLSEDKIESKESDTEIERERRGGDAFRMVY